MVELCFGFTVQNKSFRAGTQGGLGLILVVRTYFTFIFNKARHFPGALCLDDRT